MTTQHTTTIRTDEPVQIVVGDTGDGFWSPVLDEYFEHIMPTLSVAPVRVMQVMFWKRDRHTGRSRISRAELGTHCRLSKGAISEALTHLVEHPRRPLAIEAASVFVVMPGRLWRGRQVHAGEPAVRPGERPVHPGEQKFAQVNKSSPGRTAAKGTRARGEEQNQNQDDRGVVVGMLLGLGIGFTEPDAANLARAGRAAVVNAIAHAEKTRKAGRLRTGPGRDQAGAMRALIALALTQGWTLFDQAGAQEKAAKGAEDREARDLDRIGRVLSSHPSRHAHLVDPDRVLAELPAHWRSMSDVWLASKIGELQGEGRACWVYDGPGFEGLNPDDILEAETDRRHFARRERGMAAALGGEEEIGNV